MTNSETLEPDAPRPGRQFPMPIPGPHEVTAVPTSVVVGSAIRAVRRSAGPAVVSPIAETLATLASEGDPTASVVLGWMARQRRSARTTEGTVRD